MDAAWLGRMRWRRRGAWLWPTFIAATAADAVLGHALPPAGDAESLAGAAVIALVLNVIAVILLSRPLSTLLRRKRSDLPVIVARDYGGTAAIAAISLVLLTVGLVHHETVMSDRSAQRDAIVRAQAWIGDRAPAEFRRDVAYVSTFAIQPGRIYRACVVSQAHARTYCVVVDESQPFASSVRFSGYEPNTLFAEGVN